MGDGGWALCLKQCEEASEELEETRGGEKLEEGDEGEEEESGGEKGERRGECVETDCLHLGKIVVIRIKCLPEPMKSHKIIGRFKWKGCIGL